MSELYFKVVARTNGWKDRHGNWHEISTEKSLVRNDTSKGNTGDPIFLANVGADYAIVQNQDLFDYIHTIIGRTLTMEQRAGLYLEDRTAFDGKYCYRTWAFPEMYVMINNRKINFLITVCNGFGGPAVSLMAGAFEVVCTNGMIIGSAERKVRKHTKGISIPQLGAWVQKSVVEFISAGAMWSEWERTAVSTEQVAQFVLDEDSISKRLGERLSEQIGKEFAVRGMNAFAVYSALTNYATHNFVQPVRDTGNDHSAKTITDRHRMVNRWVRGKSWAAHIGSVLR